MTSQNSSSLRSPKCHLRVPGAVPHDWVRCIVGGVVWPEGRERGSPPQHSRTVLLARCQLVPPCQRFRSNWRLIEATTEHLI